MLSRKKLTDQMKKQVHWHNVLRAMFLKVKEVCFLFHFFSYSENQLYRCVAFTFSSAEFNTPS